MAAVEVQKGYKFYGASTNPNKKIVLDSLDMKVMHGSIYGLLGASGCGKTTLLSCIVGRRKLNSGNIIVLGGQPGTPGSGVPGPRVGYMPQEIALLQDFTVAESVFYFGRIYGMNEHRIHERFSLLSKLLDLPDPNRLVTSMSGGQQRRVSFACALVHEPELLILDEPTVGLDPILRERIWEFLLETTKHTKLAVIITTHYIEEAKMAHCVGLMRNGILLAEQSPSVICQRFNCDSLEDAFLQLCLKKGASEEAGILTRVQEANELAARQQHHLSQPIDVDTSDISKTSPVEEVIVEKMETRRNLSFEETKPSGFMGKVTFTSNQRMKALMSKNLIQIIRQPAGLLFCFFFPILQLSCFYAAIGGNPKGLQIGIVNDEVNHSLECYNKSLITAMPAPDFECNAHKVSCRFLLEMKDDIAEKVYYSNEKDAYAAAKAGHIVGYIHFQHNFTEALLEVLKEAKEASEGSYDNRQISVRLDKSDQQITYFLERRLRETFRNFTEGLMTSCNYLKTVGNIPIKFEEPFYGTFDEEYTEFVAPGIIMTMVFFLAAIGTSTLFITERLDGIWDRVLVAGISALEMLVAHVLTQLVVLSLQCAEMLYFAAVIFGNENKGDNLTIISLLVLLGFAGMLFGLLISIFCDSHTTASYLATGCFYPMIIMCGLLWPLEGMPQYLRYFALIFPFTIPSISMRNVLSKGWGITNAAVYNGFGVLAFWIIFFAALCVIGLKIKK